jgi:hypothetical protein
MKRWIIALLVLFAPIAPVQAYWEYGHETVAHIAQANMSANARANMHRLLRAAPMLDTPKCAMRNIGDVSVWADCIKGDRRRWGYTNSWHYQNVDICKPFDLNSACADGNCVSAQIDRNVALLSNKALPAHIRLKALAFLVHFVGDIHQPLHAGDHADRGGNDLKTTYGVMPGYNLHSVWDGLLADSALSAAPAIVRTFTPAEKAARRAQLQLQNLQQQLHHLQAAILAGDEEGGKALCIHCIDISAALQQQAHHLHVALLAGNEEGGSALCIHNLDTSAAP